MTFSINVSIFISEQVSYHPAVPLLSKHGSTTVFNLLRSSDMSSLESPAFDFQDAQERIRNYIPRDDPGDDGNPLVAGVDLCSNCRILRWLGLRRPPQASLFSGHFGPSYPGLPRMPVSSACELCQAICASFLSSTQVRYIRLSLERLADAIFVNQLWSNQERPYDLLFIDIADETGCTVT